MTGTFPEDGVLPADKSEGPTSHDVVDLVRRALGTRKVGHTGTLDPFASGLLLICVGRATRISEFLVGLEKEYEAVLRLGVATDTGDRDGRVVRNDPSWDQVVRTDVERAIHGLTGSFDQIPPLHSAKRIAGERAYRKARRGERFSLPASRVTVHRFELLSFDLPKLRVSVRCSSGTYVRALARDLGERVGVGAHLVGLRRTAIGPFTVAEAVSVEALDDPPDLERIRAVWIDPADALVHLPRIELDESQATALAHGRTTDVRLREAVGRGARAGDSDERPSRPDDTVAAAILHGELVAIVDRRGGVLRPRKVFRTP